MSSEIKYLIRFLASLEMTLCDILQMSTNENKECINPDADYGAVRGIHIGDVNNDSVKEMYFFGSGNG